MVVSGSNTEAADLKDLISGQRKAKRRLHAFESADSIL
jgi:hypothetical protein